MYFPELNDLTHQTTDFHFDTLESQIEFHSNQKVELKPGDFLVTRHSNLNSAHVVFHLVCNQPSLNRCKSKLYAFSAFMLQDFWCQEPQ